MATNSRSNPIHAQPSQRTVALRYSMDAAETACEAVCRAVATVENCSVLELEPVGRIIDSDALNALFSSTDRDNEYRLTFQYAGHEVVVSGDEITVLSAS